MLLGIDAHWSTARACVPRASLVGSRGQPSRRQRGVICKARPPVNPPRPLDAHAAPPPPQPPNLQELASDSWWMGMLLFRVLLITLTLGYSGIGLLWELQHLDLQHLTAWDKAGAALMVESVQLCVVWGLLARAADEKQTSVLGGMLHFDWSWQAVWLGGAGAAVTFALNAGLTIAAALLLALLAALAGSPEEATVAIQTVSSAPDAEIAAVLRSGDGVSAAAMLVASGLLAPLLEEVVYRGLLLPALLPRASPAVAVGTSAAVFAASHMSVSRFFPLLCLGVVLGTLRVRAADGNLAPCTVAHMVHNGAILTAMMVSINR